MRRMGKRFTVVFEGDIAAFPSNPLKVDTVFGLPETIYDGDGLDERDRITAERDALAKQVDVLESNARVQAKLLADTGRERDGLRKALELARSIVSATCDPIIEASTAEPYRAVLAQIDAALTPALTDADGSGSREDPSHLYDTRNPNVLRERKGW